MNTTIPTPANLSKPLAPTDRMNWVDVAKAYGMFLVYAGHILEYTTSKGSRSSSLIYQWIYAFHMPLFFLLSGFVSRARSFDLPRRAITRLTPFVFFNVLSLLILLVVDTVTHNLRPGYYAFGLVSMARGYPLFNFMAWFVVCLFCVELMNLSLQKLLGSGFKVLLGSFALFGVGLLVLRKEMFFVDTTGLAQGFWFLKQALFAQWFYQVGKTAREAGLFQGNRRILDIVVLLVCGGLLLACFRRNTTVNLAGAVLGNPALMVLNALAGSALIFALARLTPPTSPFLAVGRNTLALMGINGLFVHFLNVPIGRWLLSVVPDQFAPMLVAIVVTSVLSLAASIPVAVALKRYAPEFLGSLEGDRPAWFRWLSARSPALKDVAPGGPGNNASPV